MKDFDGSGGEKISKELAEPSINSNENDSVPPQPPQDGKVAKRSRFSFRRNKTESENAKPEMLVALTGKKVSAPTFEEFDRTKNITYAIREPFQYVNLVEVKGEIVYNALEPVLNEREKEILKKIQTAYEMLVNVGTVLVETEDKIKFVDNTFNRILKIYNIKLSELEYQKIHYFIERDYVRYGKADLLISDKFIEDVSCNGPKAPLYVYHRLFESIRTNVVFEEFELNSFILRLAQLSGRHISILQPIRDAALPDGSRLNLTLGKEVTKKGSTFTIRKFRSEPMSPIEIMSLKTLDAKALAYLWLLVEYDSSILISGGTATGKTTLLNAVSMLIRSENKIVSVEDTPEINLAHPNWIQAVARFGFGETISPSGASGGLSGISGMSGHSSGDISLYDLLMAALRQRPDYIIVGEVRGQEAFTLFQAISVGHAAMGTIHAASMPELIARVESMPMNVPRVLVRNLDLVIFLALIRKGKERVRRVREIVEILSVDPGSKELVTNTVFRWNPIKDEHEFAGQSYILEKLSKTYGIPQEYFDREIETRTRLLENLKERKIINYRQVTDVIRDYYARAEQHPTPVQTRKKVEALKIEQADNFDVYLDTQSGQRTRSFDLIADEIRIKTLKALEKLRQLEKEE